MIRCALLIISSISCLELSSADEIASRRETIKVQWQNEITPFLKSRDLSPKKTEILYRLVTNSSPQFFRAEYRRVTTEYVPYRGALEYDYTLLQGIVLECIRRKDVQELQRIVKVNCPLYITNRPLEYLVVAEFGSKAFEMFFAAFDATANTGTREKLSEMICRAFPGDASVPAPERVELARAYFSKSEKRFRLNREYINNNDPRPGLFLIANE